MKKPKGEYAIQTVTNAMRVLEAFQRYGPLDDERLEGLPQFRIQTQCPDVGHCKYDDCDVEYMMTVLLNMTMIVKLCI